MWTSSSPASPVLDWTLAKGIQAQVNAFRAGFSTIFPVNDLRAFSPDELVVLFGSADEDWSAETLAEVLKADHGYNSESGSIANLIEVMSAYDAEERREYLQFVTGAPKLPIGGASGPTELGLDLSCLRLTLPLARRLPRPQPAADGRPQGPRGAFQGRRLPALRHDLRQRLSPSARLSFGLCSANPG